MTQARLFTKPFALVTASAFGYFFGYAVLLPVLPPFVDEELGMGKLAIGATGAAFALTALVFRPFVGRVGDRRGRRLLILSGTALVAASTLAMVAASSYPVLLALRLVGGAGEAMFFVGAASAISDMAPPERRGEALSLFSISLYSGIALGPSVGEWLADTRGYDAVWIASALVTAVAFLFALPTPDMRPPAGSASSKRLLHPAGVKPGLIMITSVFGFAGLMNFIERYGTQVLRMGAIRGVLLMYGAMLVGIRLFGARIPDRYGVERVGVWGLAGSTVGLAIIGLVPTVPGLFAGVAVFAIGQALAFPALMALSANSAPPHERGAAVGTTTAFIDAGFFVGPLVFGAVAAAASIRDAFLVGAMVAALGWGAQMVLRRASN